MQELALASWLGRGGCECGYVVYASLVIQVQALTTLNFGTYFWSFFSS